MGRQSKSYNLFKPEWMRDARFAVTCQNGQAFFWVRSASDKRAATCILCSTTINVATMGVSALVKHQKNVKHCELARLKSLSNFEFPASSQTKSLSSNPSSSSTSVVPHVQHNDPCDKPSIPVHSDDTFRAEILWLARNIMEGESKRSVSNLPSLFRRMFSDSAIARSFRMEKDKARYLATYGIGSYFKTEHERALASCKDIVILFDEAMNTVVQKCQMDVYAQYFCEKSQRAVAMYLSSVFMTKARASDILAAFHSVISEDLRQKILQIQMDGPAVNWAFLRSLNEEMGKKKPLDLGSCGLHAVHGALQFGFESKGSPDWDISSFLRGLYYIFHDSPARQGEFRALCGDDQKLPMKFCPTRWTENVPVVDRALAILDSLRKYSAAVESGNEVEIGGVRTKLTVPKSKSFTKVQQALKDPILEARLWFFRSLSCEVLDFLKKYQTEQPVIVFLYNDVLEIVKCFLRRIVKEAIVDEWDPSVQAVKVLLSNSDNFWPSKMWM